MKFDAAAHERLRLALVEAQAAIVEDAEASGDGIIGAHSFSALGSLLLGTAQVFAERTGKVQVDTGFRHFHITPQQHLLACEHVLNALDPFLNWSPPTSLPTPKGVV